MNEKGALRILEAFIFSRPLSEPQIHSLYPLSLKVQFSILLNT
jgi:hypothetical protein